MIIPSEFPYSDDPSRDAEKTVFTKLKNYRNDQFNTIC